MLSNRSQGRVKPTMQLKDGVQVNDDEGLEHEAEAMGTLATAGVLQARRPETRSDPIVAGAATGASGRAERRSVLQPYFYDIYQVNEPTPNEPSKNQVNCPLAGWSILTTTTHAGRLTSDVDTRARCISP